MRPREVNFSQVIQIPRSKCPHWHTCTSVICEITEARAVPVEWHVWDLGRLRKLRRCQGQMQMPRCLAKSREGWNSGWEGTKKYQKLFWMCQHMGSVDSVYNHTPELLRKNEGVATKKHIGSFQFWCYYSTACRVLLRQARWKISLDKTSWKIIYYTFKEAFE